MSAMLLLLKKSRESLYLMGLCVSLMLEICGVMIFIAKKGGISLEVVHFSVFFQGSQTRLQYFSDHPQPAWLSDRHWPFLFPLFFSGNGAEAFHGSAIRRNGRLQLLRLLVPAAMLILYFPPIYRILVAGNEALQKTLQHSAGSGSIFICYSPLDCFYMNYFLLH